MSEGSPRIPESVIGPKPEFDGGDFTIDFFTRSPQGLEVVTDNSLPPRDQGPDGRPLRSLDLTDREEQLLRTNWQNEATRFGYPKDFPRTELQTTPGKSPLADLRRQQLAENPPTKEDLQQPYQPSPEESELLQRRQELIEQAQLPKRLGYLVGIENPRLVGNVIHIDTRRVAFGAYNALSLPDMSQEVEDISYGTGVCAVIRTADNKIVLQHRLKEQERTDPTTGVTKVTGNANYGDVPGAGAAGLLKAALDHDATRTTAKGVQVPDRGKIEPVTTETVINAIAKEGQEELGLQEGHAVSRSGQAQPVTTESVIEAITHEGQAELGFREGQVSYVIVGLEKEKKPKPHVEIVVFGNTTLTFDELKEQARTTKKNLALSEQDFDEKFVAIDATVQAIETITTEWLCPLPRTHAGAYILAGYMLKLEQEGLSAAEEWMRGMEPRVRENSRRVNTMVQDHYRKNPQLLEEKDPNPLRPARNPFGYSAAYPPDAQGLPGFDEEWERTNHLLLAA